MTFFFLSLFNFLASLYSFLWAVSKERKNYKNLLFDVSKRWEWKIKNKRLFIPQAQDSVLLSEDIRTQLEQVQQRLNLVREEVVENSISREKESFNARRAQVTTSTRAKDWEWNTYWNVLRIWRVMFFPLAWIYFTVKYTDCWCEVWLHILPVLYSHIGAKLKHRLYWLLQCGSWHKIAKRRVFLPSSCSLCPQEDISKLRRKIEKAKKPAEKISNGDDILNEEINEYKVCLLLQANIKHFTVSLILLQGHNCVWSLTKRHCEHVYDLGLCHILVFLKDQSHPRVFYF